VFSFVFRVGHRVQVPFEVVEPFGPHRSIGLEPCVDLFERFGADAIQAALRVGPHLDEAGLAEYSKMLGHRGLAEGELVDEVAHWTLVSP
jgi:hypothetical protein